MLPPSPAGDIMIDAGDSKWVAVARAVGVSRGGRSWAHCGTREQVSGQASARRFSPDPQEARRICEGNGVDALAVAIGTAHGLIREAQADLQRLEAIRA